MAGSISLSMQTIFGSTGQLLGGGQVIFIVAGTTSTPQNAYYDSALTAPLPYPYTLDASSRMPGFYLADGQIKVRILDENGVQQFMQDNILVVGPSSGGGAGGGVDPTVVFQTGDCLWLDVQGTRTGWVRDNGRSIGSATSSATERANADTSSLFAYLWNTFSNTICPVSGGRGANAAADFAANKNITLPDKRGYIPGGLDDMGNSAAGRYANVPVVSGSVTDAGSVLGETTHTQTALETPSLPTTGIAASTSTTTTITGGNLGGVELGGSTTGAQTTPVSVVTIAASSVSTTTISGTINATGGAAHNNVQKTVLGSFFRKL